MRLAPAGAASPPRPHDLMPMLALHFADEQSANPVKPLRSVVRPEHTPITDGVGANVEIDGDCIKDGE
jgi:hypothetical protein